MMRGTPNSVEAIIAEVAGRHCLTVAEITGKVRSANLVEARREIARTLTEDYGVGLADIGNALGGRDHTTIMSLLGRTQVTPATATAIPAPSPAILPSPAGNPGLTIQAALDQLGKAVATAQAQIDAATVKQVAAEGALAKLQHSYGVLQGKHALLVEAVQGLHRYLPTIGISEQTDISR